MPGVRICKMTSMLSSVQGSESLRENLDPASASGPRLGFLVSRYPAVSHTFILNEVLELRKLGFCLETVSINLPDRKPSDLPLVEQREAQSTHYIKKEGPLGAVAAALTLLCRRPRAFLSALLFSLRIGNGSAGEALMNVFYFAEAVILGAWLERRNLTHVHVHFGNAASTVAMIAARAYPITFSLTIHGPEEFYEVGRNALKQKIEAASFVRCIGFFARSQLMKVSDPSSWHKYRLTPLGVDVTQFLPRPFRRNPQRWEILCIGRLIPSKGQLILLRALRGLLAEHRNIHCRFVGDGPDRAALTEFATRELPRGSVTFEGAVNADQVLDYLSQADMFVLPSFAEGIPVALMEAMSMEVPCISTMVAGIPELIRHGVDALLVSPSDEFGLGSAISLLMDDEGMRRRLGVAGRERVIARYNLQHNVRILAETMRCELIKS